MRRTAANADPSRRIVVLDGYTNNPGDLSWAGLADLGELARCADATILLTNKAALIASDLEQLPLVRYSGVLTTGVNVVDLGAFLDGRDSNRVI